MLQIHQREQEPNGGPPPSGGPRLVPLLSRPKPNSNQFNYVHGQTPTVSIAPVAHTCETMQGRHSQLFHVHPYYMQQNIVGHPYLHPFHPQFNPNLGQLPTIMKGWRYGDEPGRTQT